MKIFTTHLNDIRDVAIFLLGYAASDEEKLSKMARSGIPVEFGYFGKRVNKLVDAVLASGEYDSRPDSWDKNGRRSGAATYLAAILAGMTTRIIGEEGYSGLGLSGGDWLYGAIMEAAFTLEAPLDLLDDETFKPFWRKEFSND